VIELEEPGLLAAPPILGDERAAHPIARHRLPPRLPRHVPAAPARLRRPRLLHTTEFPRLDLLDQRVERAIHHLGEISRRHLMAKQRRCPAARTPPRAAAWRTMRAIPFSALIHLTDGRLSDLSARFVFD
jgi:hypothetical protein